MKRKQAWPNPEASGYGKVQLLVYNLLKSAEKYDALGRIRNKLDKKALREDELHPTTKLPAKDNKRNISASA